jgi:adenylyltransferase/sulfurtransferase
VLGVLPGIVGTIQATEALKLLLDVGDPLIGRLLLIDALATQFRTVRLERDPACPACGTREIQQLIDYDQFCGSAPPAAVAMEMTPRELSQRLANHDAVDVIDVREPHEWQIARLPGARLIPLGTLSQAIASIDRDRDVVVHCHHGIRSAHAAAMLRTAGFTRVWNLAGGIDRWSDEVDPRVPKY